MLEHHITTPFGGGRFSARLARHQQAVAEKQARLQADEGGNATGQADKWALIDALTEARFALGLNDRAIAVLEGLLSFVSGRVLDGRAPLVVFPSNRALSARLRGMSASTLRRHLADLAEKGLLIRRDSPNGKRYRVRGEAGEPDAVFGFDLAPLVLMADEIHQAAEAARGLYRKEKALRAEITLQQRDIGRILAAALAEERPGAWHDWTARFAALSLRIRRSLPLDELTRRLDHLIALRAEVEKAYLSSLSENELSTNDLHFERHIQNSNTDPSFELNGNEILEEGKFRAADETLEDADEEDADPAAPAPERKHVGLGLERVLKACPALSDYAPGGRIAGPGDFFKVTALVRSMLGISPDAWKKAEETLGREQAAAVIAMMLERAEAIRSPGGYLRSLTKKAEKGQFSVLPMLKALERGDG